MILLLIYKLEIIWGRVLFTLKLSSWWFYRHNKFCYIISWATNSYLEIPFINDNGIPVVWLPKIYQTTITRKLNSKNRMFLSNRSHENQKGLSDRKTLKYLLKLLIFRKCIRQFDINIVVHSEESGLRYY